MICALLSLFVSKMLFTNKLMYFLDPKSVKRPSNAKKNLTFSTNVSFCTIIEGAVRLGTPSKITGAVQTTVRI